MPYVDRQGRTCGFMDVEQEDQSGRFLRRYFMVDQERGLFLWYMDNPSNLPDGTPPVGEIQLSLISNARDASKQRPKVQFCFVVSIPSKNYYFKADNQQDMEEWVLSLNKACRVTVPVTEPSKVGGPLRLDIDKANSQANTSPKSPVRGLSYTTEIVGGVVHRKAVESSEKRATLPCTDSLATFSTTQCEHSETDSEDESASLRARSWPRSASPTSLGEKTLPSAFPGRNMIKSGWCVKQGGVRKNWKRRFFILDDQGLAYYKSSTDKLPLKTIAKKDITVCRISDIGGTLQRDNLFEIISPSRTFFIQAYSPDEMAEWINSINEVRGPKRASAPQASLKLNLSSKILECTRDIFCEGKERRPKTPQENSRTVKYTKSPKIEIRVDQPPEEESDVQPVWEKGPSRSESRSDRADGEGDVVIMDYVVGPETSL